MIASLTILNFLSHKDTSLDFSPGVNIIVGPTDSGKSAVIKALKWIIFNRPMGDGIRSSWGGLTSVGILVEPGHMIFRHKDQNLNKYIIANQEFNALKGDVPAEVLQALNLSDINLQTQFDSHFLLSNSSGEVAQYFNKVAHLDKIDLGLQNINKWTRELQKKIEYNQGVVDGNQEKLLNYGSLDSIEKNLISLEGKETKRQQVLEARLGLLKEIDGIKEVDDKLKEIDFLSELGVTVENLLGLYNKKKEAWQSKILLSSGIGVIRQVEMELKDLEIQLGRWEGEFHDALGKGSVCPLCGSVIK